MVFCNVSQNLSFISYVYCHNPYFNRWFSAIPKKIYESQTDKIVTILILIDGFLQYKQIKTYDLLKTVTILILIDGFLQF